MQDIGEGTIRRIDWQELLPAVLLLRIFNTALGLRMLFVSLGGLMFSLALCASLNNEIGNCATAPVADSNLTAADFMSGITPLLVNTILYKSIRLPLKFYSDIVVPIFTCRVSDKYIWFIGNTVIWFFITGILVRIAAVRLTIDERESFGSIYRFFLKRGLGFISSVLILGIAIAFCLLLVKLTTYLTFLAMPLTLLFAFFTSVLFIGLSFGFPLLVSAVAVDGADGFEAISRMFSYLYQRPLHYAVYWLYASIIGVLLYLFVSLFVSLTLDIATCVWAEQISVNLTAVLFSAIPAAAMFAWFWTSSTAIYILLRRSVDAAPFNEVYRLEHPKQIVLPKIENI